MVATKVLIVCSGNICRSPMAEVVADYLARRAGLDLQVDSAGTGGWHEGEAMDRRAVAALGARGYDGAHHTARQVVPGWLAARHLVVAADRGHLRDLQHIASRVPSAAPVILLGAFSADPTEPDIPDPYYGETTDFVRCLDLIERCCEGLVVHLARHPLAQ